MYTHTDILHSVSEGCVYTYMNAEKDAAFGVQHMNVAPIGLNSYMFQKHFHHRRRRRRRLSLSFEKGRELDGIGRKLLRCYYCYFLYCHDY